MGRGEGWGGVWGVREGSGPGERGLTEMHYSKLKDCNVTLG